MNGWQWFGVNAAQVQSFAALVGIVLTVVTIAVLIVTWKAVKLQADAARALTNVAEEQTKAAKTAAASAEAQTRLLAEQLELSAAPLLIFEPDDRPMGIYLKLVNRGQGAAFQVRYWQGGFEFFHPRPGTGYICKLLEPSTLAPGMSVYLNIPQEWRGWTVKYKGIDDQERATNCDRDNVDGQRHIIRRGGKEVTLQ